MRFAGGLGLPRKAPRDQSGLLDVLPQIALGEAAMSEKKTHLVRFINVVIVY